MTKFRLEGSDKLSDRIHVRVDDKYTVTVIRTAEGLVIDVYPKDWDAPIDTMTVWDSDAVVDHENG